ncbi:MAG: Gfo/Idh/MocA family oxidoreductase [Planctomycetota bacterium]
MDPFRIALIGAGGIARTHAKAAQDTDGRVVVSHAVDVNEQAAADLAKDFNAKALGSFDHLLDAIKGGEPIDGLVVCTPPNARLGIIQAAVERGKAVLVEKPLAHTVDDARKLQQLWERHRDVPVGVAYCHRFAPPIVRMRELVEDGKIGRMTRFENTFAFHFPGMAEKWMSDPAVAGGGACIDTGSHSVDLFHFLAGPSEVAGAVFDYEWDGRGESSASVVLRSRVPGVAGFIAGGWMEPERFTVTLVGTGGLMHYDYMDAETIRFKGVDGTEDQIEVETHDLRFRNQLLAFADHARGGDVGRLATFADGLAASETIDAAARLSKVI